MNRLYILIISVVTVFMLLFTTTGCLALSLKPKNSLHPKQKIQATFQKDSDTFSVNGRQYKMDALPRDGGDPIYVPVEYMVKALGISENNMIRDSQKTTLNNKNVTVTIEPGRLLFVNGEPIKPFRYAKAAFVDEASGKMYVAVTPLAKAFGYDVIYDPDSERIDIITGLPLVEQDLAIGEIRVGMSEKRLTELLGQPIQVHHEQYAGWENKLKGVEYSGLKIRLRKNGDWEVTSIHISWPNYPTHRGIKVGDPLDKVIKVYGLGYYKYGRGVEGDGSYEYRFLTSFNVHKGITFTVQNNKIMGISIFDYVNPEDAH